MKEATKINKLIGKIEKTDDISDGFHTFGELYEHRIVLYIGMAGFAHSLGARVWRSKVHSDGSKFDGWFVLGIFEKRGEQITYHLPNKYWQRTGFAVTYDKAPEYDGHTSAQVLTRIKKMFKSVLKNPN